MFNILGAVEARGTVARLLSVPVEGGFTFKVEWFDSSSKSWVTGPPLGSKEFFNPGSDVLVGPDSPIVSELGIDPTDVTWEAFKPGTLEKAIEIAARMHSGQRTKDGLPYILHPLHVMANVESIDEKIVAVLHDIVEDTECTLDDLKSHGFANDIIDAVRLVTKSKGCDYHKYITKIKANPLARAVKLADLKHNSDLSRLTVVREKDIKRREKYLEAIEFLPDGKPFVQG